MQKLQLFFKKLSNQLNIIHSTNNSIRYWEIIIGHWLRSFLWTIFNRLQTMELIKNENKINKVLIFDTSELDLAISDSFDLNILANNDYFNALILSKIINQTNIFKFKFFKNKIIKNNFLNIKRKKQTLHLLKKY